MAEAKLLAERFKVELFPTVFYMSDGKLIKRDLGSKSVDEIREDVKKYFK